MLDQPVVLITGAIAAGKTHLAKNLSRRFALEHFKTRDAIRARLGSNNNRELLQEVGRSLDGDTNGRWIVEELEKVIDERVVTGFVVDAIRTPEQVRALRERFSHIVHIHLIASDVVLRERFKIRNNFDVQDSDYDSAKRCPVEQAINKLADLSDGVIDTGWSSPGQSFERALVIMGEMPHEQRLVDVLLGGQFGSEGKGNVAAYVAPEYDVLIRSGGPNAGHSVWEPEGTYVFHHLPSGTRCTKSQIVLAPGAVMYIPRLLEEIKECDLTPTRLSIDPNAMIISDEDKVKEANGLVGSIGSTGQGVGQATARKVLRGMDTCLAKDHMELAKYIRPTSEILEEAYSNNRRVLVEGTQGTGLSLHHGPFPYCLHKDTKILLADGTSRRIGDIVDSREQVSVLSKNKQGILEAKPVVKFYKSDHDGTWMRIITDHSIFSTQDGCYYGGRITPNHKVPLADGREKEVKDLKAGDKLFTGSAAIMGAVEQVVIGSLLGDGSIPRPSKNLQISHGERQLDYLAWKASILQPVLGGRVSQGRYGDTSFKPGNRYDRYISAHHPDIQRFVPIRYPSLTEDLLSSVGRLALAIWYQDDGRLKHSNNGQEVNFYTNGFTAGECAMLCKMLRDKFSIESTINVVKSPAGKRYPTIRVSRGSHDKLFDTIARFVHEDLQYKLPVEWQGKFCQVDPEPAMPSVTTVLAVENASRNARYADVRYNIEVADNHNYFMSTRGYSMLVNNCTSRDCAVSGLLSEAGIPPARVNHVMMICRTYPIRVQSPQDGTSGPMHKEITIEEIHEMANIPLPELQKTETTSTTKRKRRIGEFDWDLLKKSCQLNAPTDIALTFVDYLDIKNRDAANFDELDARAKHLIQRIEEQVGVPVSLISKKFGPDAIIDRRVWA